MPPASYVLKPAQVKPYVRYLACKAFLEVSAEGIRKNAELAVRMQQVYPRHARLFVEEHAREIQDIVIPTLPQLLYNPGKNQPWAGTSLIEFFHETRSEINNVYNPEFLAEKGNREEFPSGRTLEDLRMATKARLWNKHQLELVEKNRQLQGEPAQDAVRTPDGESASVRKGGRKRQMEVIPFDVNDPAHRHWTPISWIAWIHLGMGSETPHEKFSLQASGETVPAENVLTPDSVDRHSRSWSEQRRKRRLGDSEWGQLDQPLSRVLNDVCTVMSEVKDALVDMRLAREKERMARERDRRTRELRVLCELTKDTPEYAKHHAELVKHLLSPSTSSSDCLEDGRRLDFHSVGDELARRAGTSGSSSQCTGALSQRTPLGNLNM
ncbi:hypothetical protein GUITHDRAFT_114970 [Guillardia theta CCMP2712]|uniref:Uncharacterized protein n=2 Tax=Guillardia theta TaxID=55529 RepID=L1ISJ5_GUITC|nr:hypothetical protein GUITHDRAFT_114970 [Guillardia theta CCMP2712]EKX38864.1 hypothetical protein GUITHDRAFT_114970 [Guillardia theta CCMP2712]|eukprot:XP_005825844.1 hypothetical protein GUITHDRAFT_114970 [Guillardia theta CCMP2712]